MQNLSEFEHLSPANRHKVLQEVKKASQVKAKELGVGKLGNWTYSYFEFNPDFDRRDPNSSYLHCATCDRGVKYLYVCYDSINYFGDQIRKRYDCSSYHFFQMLTEVIYQSFLKRNLIFQDNDIQYKSLINQDGDPIS